VNTVFNASRSSTTELTFDANGNIASFERYYDSRPPQPGRDDFKYTYTRRSDSGLVYNFHKQAFTYLDIFELYNANFILPYNHKEPVTSYIYNYFDTRTNQRETKVVNTNAVFDASNKLLSNSFVSFDFGGGDIRTEYLYTYEQY
jgi:hypothetical protein